ncbi:MAG: methionine adenosyltransferase [bacterium]|nr:methionine adenosyltransferase [bacterium]MBK8128408.1 methionine adenosyltransferase [bacterium]
MSTFVFSSESVSEGHPDKIADQISDAVLDAMLKDDSMARVACETFVTTGMALVGGEITTHTYVDIPALVRSVIKEIGYTNAAYGFDYETCAVITTIDKQSPDISQAVDADGAGDQGMMFGYATTETPEMMPLPIVLSHKLMLELAKMRRAGKLGYLRPDAKSQVSVRYVDNKPTEITAIVVSTQHDPSADQKTIEADLKRDLLPTVLGNYKLASDCKIYINPSGRFVVGGPQGDAGLTGRKIIVDTYGGWAPHGGGAFSGKDPTKVDRSGAYAARWIAKNVVAAGLAERCMIQVAYAIGVAQPVSLMVNTYGTGKAPDEEIEAKIRKNFDLSVRGIITALDLRRPIYRKTAAYGHFGRSEETFTWEKTDRVNSLA